MAKIAIYSDGPYNIRGHYAQFTENHDIQVFPVLLDVKNPIKELEKLLEAGFKEEKIRAFPGKLEGDLIVDADVYFVEDVFGRCVEFPHKLPKDKTWYVGMDTDVLRKLRKKGYNAIDFVDAAKKIEKIVESQ